MQAVKLTLTVNKMQSYSSSLSRFNDEYFDFGLVDGHFRMECIYNSLKKIKKNGILIIDNSDAIDGVDLFIKNINIKNFLMVYGRPQFYLFKKSIFAM